MYEFQDSQYESGVPVYRPGALMHAIDTLQHQFESGELDIISIRNYNLNISLECPIWYKVLDYRTLHNNLVPDLCEVFTSHYIGRFSYEGTSISINPRFGSFNYLISSAANLYLPQGSSDISKNNSSNSYWLIALLWKAMLNKALTYGQIPKEYIVIKNNQKNFRGRLLVSRHIHANLCDASKFYCTYKKLTPDTLINRTIRTVYKALKNKGLSPLVKEFEEYDRRLSSMGVGDSVEDIRSIDDILYTRLNYVYKPVMNISRSILSNINAESCEYGQHSDISYFVDVAEIWELYLLKLLQRSLPNKYIVYSPNTDFGDFLIDKSMRQIRPDIIVELDGRIMIIIDAKYKMYKQIGKTGKWPNVQREDLFQMSTYLYHYSKGNAPIAGVFTSPVIAEDSNAYNMTNNQSHKIGVINLDLESAGDDIVKIHQAEKVYVDAIINLLETL